MRLRPDISLGLQTGKSCSVHRRTASKPAPIAVTVPDANIDLFAREIDLMQVGRDPQINAGMGFGKPAQPVDQPFRREIR